MLFKKCSFRVRTPIDTNGAFAEFRVFYLLFGNTTDH